MSWDERLVEDFLQEYREHECLWNPFHPQFHDCLAKGEALKQVVKNLRFGFGVQDCLKLLKRIREKYVEDQTKNLLTLRSNVCQPKWMRIVESMLEKIVSDEDRKRDYLAPILSKPEPAVKILFRHTIPSRKRKCAANPKKQKRRRRNRKARGKLERRAAGRCCDNAERDVDPCRAAPDCSRPQTSWCKQRDDYLDRLRWTKPRTAPIDCPGMAKHAERCSRIENVGKDPCATTPVYMCPNRDTHVNCNFNQSHGRRRHTDIQPTITESRSCRSPPPPRPTCPPPPRPTCPPPPPRRPSRERSPCPSAKKTNPCPSECPAEPKKSIADIVCTRDTCPSYTRLKPNDSTSKSKACEITSDRGVRFDAPRVAARFENGVLEACSQFKVVFPTSSQDQQPQKKRCCAQKVQTDSTTRECAVGVSSRELLRKRSSARCPRRKDVQTGTCEDLVECCCPNNNGSEASTEQNACHDYVLLTPGGRYVPLVKTKSDEEECPCAAESQKRDACEVTRREPSPARNCEKSSDDEKCPCPSATTKLLLRCLEHMLNLEEQQSCPNAKTADEGISCEPCSRRKEQQICPPCALEERRGKLTQNFLEILKCAIDLDEHQEDSPGSCQCSSSSSDKVECSDKTVQRKVSTREAAVGGTKSCGESKATQQVVKSVDEATQCDARRSRDKQVKRGTVLDNLVRCANWPDYKTARDLSVALKCDEEDDESTCIKRIPATTLPPSPLPARRDRALACLREELQRDKELFDRDKVSYVKCNQVYRSYVVRSPTHSPTRSSAGCYR